MSWLPHKESLENGTNLFPRLHKALLTLVAKKHSDMLLFGALLKESRHLTLQ